MSLFAIGDFHFCSSAPEKSMERLSARWENYENRIIDNYRKLIGPGDTCVITGDHSWGKKLADCESDLKRIEELPGRKILLRGNHDSFWGSKKTASLNEMFKGRLEFLQNNYYAYEDYALVGTKGYCYEGKDSIEHYIKIMQRELERLKWSFDAAEADGFKKFIMFLHYPPTSIGETESVFTKMAEYYGVEQVIYSHSHGHLRYDDSIKGEFHGITYRLVSSDYLQFVPVKIL